MRALFLILAMTTAAAAGALSGDHREAFYVVWPDASNGRGSD